MPSPCCVTQVSGTLLSNASMLPPGEDPSEVWELPVPCPPDFLEMVVQWELDTEEAEDLEERRREVYGVGGGNPFGLVSGDRKQG